MKHVIDNLNKEYEHLGIKVKNLTCYVRFQNEKGETIEPTYEGAEIRKKITIQHTVETATE